MNAITMEQAQAHLPELIEQLKPGEEVEITKGSRTVAKIVAQRKPRAFGLGKGKLTIVTDADEHLKDFAEYMPRGCCSIPMLFSGCLSKSSPG